MSGPQTSLRLFLVRHGQVPANREFRFVGTRDEELTEQGIREAEALARGFERIEVDLVLSSPKRRALETARTISSNARVEPDLVEQDFGAWEGLSRDEVLALGAPHRAALDSFDQSADASPPEGESMSAVRDRVETLVDRLLEDGVESAVLVSHVGPIKALLSLALNLPVEAVRPMFLDTGSLSVVDWGSPRLLRLFNCRGDLGWHTARWIEARGEPVA